ncbi:hypothetical protein RchiOBHm_Chr1g0371611 [Rosa chinensis]|uniref:Uncharacterized protein n=1 Tax=Rosa chinensis TaxID=74649 RepID=A0A2P6SLJ7_ROSCH|nr:hypothetical protein RchiOBHm_Chr1g0371611 [Rosa chinensis]
MVCSVETVVKLMDGGSGGDGVWCLVFGFKGGGVVERRWNESEVRIYEWFKR